jgi:hypothetical protein
LLNIADLNNYIKIAAKTPERIRRAFLRILTKLPIISASSAAKTFPSGRARFHWARFIHYQFSAVVFLSVKHINGFGCLFIIGHFHKSETFGASGHPISYDSRRFHGPGSGKVFLERILSGAIRQPANV